MLKFASAAALLALSAPLLAQTVTTRQVGGATLQNVPDIPDDVREAVQRYQNNRSASFEDWLPDGSMLISTRFGATSQLHRVASPGSARTQLTFAAEPIANAKVIPGTDRFVFSRDTGGDEWFQLYARGLTGTASQLTEAGTRNSAPTFSADGSLMVWSRSIKDSAGYTLFGLDLPVGKPRVLYTSDGAIDVSDVASDKKRLIFLRSPSNVEDRVFELDIATGKVRAIATGTPASYRDVRYLPGGQRLIAISNRDSDTQQLVEIDLATGKQTVLTPGLKWDVESYDLTGDGRVIAYSINEDGLSRVIVQDRVTRRALPQPTLPKGVLTALKFDGAGRRLAIGLSSATSAGDVWSWDVNEAQLTRWTTSELGDLDPASLAEPALIRFKSFDGLSIPAFVYRPRDVPADAKTPVIIDIHGGPEAQTRPNWNYGAQYFADALKATVILPNVRGSDGYGKRYISLDDGVKREDSVKDIGALLDWIGAQPGLDAKRVAVYGQSYGGYMSLAVMTHYSDRLVGGVERYGISNWVSFLQNTEAYRRDNRRAEYGDERDPKVRAVLERISPLANIASIGKPMLVMQGANDPRVPQAESDQVVAKLRANGNEVWYVLFADEGHGFQKKPNNDLRREVETVFLRRLFNE